MARSLIVLLKLLLFFLIVDDTGGQCRRLATVGIPTNQNLTGEPNNTSSASIYEPRLELNQFSACAIGVWLLYPLPNFNAANLNAPVQLIFGPSELNNVGFNLSSLLGGQVLSYRSVGDPEDYRKDSLTLYEGHWFNGRQEHLSKSLYAHLTMNQKSASLIVTGMSPWTIYSQPGFKGDFKCIYPPKSTNFMPYFAPNTVDIQVAQHTIRSVRKGCFTKFIGFLNFLKPQQKEVQ